MPWYNVGISLLLLLQASNTKSLLINRCKETSYPTLRKERALFAVKSIALEANENVVLTSDTTLVSLVHEFQLIPTDALRASLATNPKLIEAVETLDLSEWSKEVGKLPRGVLQKGLEQHPRLMASALSSEQLHTIDSLLSLKDTDESALISNDKLKKKVRKENPSLSRQRVRKLLHFFQVKLHLSEDESRNLVCSKPKLLQYKSLDSFGRIVDYLSVHVGVTNVGKMVKRWPILLTYPVETRIQPGVLFLKSLGKSRWERVLIKYPQVLTHSVETVLQPKLLFLEQLLDIPAGAKQLVTHYPPLLWLSTELLQRKFEFLQQALALTKVETESLIETYPQVLGLSVENNLTPKIAYLRTYLTVEELRDFCLYQPALLAYSLANRIAPRIEQMERVNIRFAYAPAYLMSLPDAKFDNWYVYLMLVVYLCRFFLHQRRVVSCRHSYLLLFRFICIIRTGSNCSHHRGPFHLRMTVASETDGKGGTMPRQSVVSYVQYATITIRSNYHRTSIRCTNDSRHYLRGTNTISVSRHGTRPADPEDEQQATRFGSTP